MNMLKPDLRLLMLHKFEVGHDASETYTNINRTPGEEFTFDRTHESGSKNSVVNMRTLRMMKVKDKHAVLQAFVKQNHCQNVTEMSTFGFSTATISSYLQSIGKAKKLYIRVPHELN